MNLSRAAILVVFAYVVALAAALSASSMLPFEHPVAIAAAADAVATLVIFAFSYAFANSSFYDAYWSVAPVPIALYWATQPQSAGSSGLRQAFVLALVALWGARLTYNWARSWKGLHHEDWRYIDLRARNPKSYWFVSFAGIHFFPTIVVFLGCSSVWVAMTGRDPFGVLDVCALGLTAGAIWIEARADRELHRFRATNARPGAILDSGLWALSRHPNYFGEMSFWWGLWLFGVAASPDDWWWTALGPVIITSMFRFVSLPMMEERMSARRPGYDSRAAKTPLVIPWPPRA